MSDVKGRARRLGLVLAGLMLAMPVAGTIAANTSQNEIVYRTNLGRADDVKILLSRGASANQTDANGVPLLSLAAARKDEEGLSVVKMLLDNGADINGVDAKGQTALFYAGKNGNRPVAELLLDRGINYNVTDDNGNIARTVAFRAGNPKIVDAIDAYVVSQSEKIARQYEELNRTLEERYNELNADAQKKEEHDKLVADEQAKQAEEQKLLATMTAKQQQEYLRKKALTENSEIEKKRSSPEFNRGMEGLAFQNCAFQYWSYCKEAGQSSELTPEQLDIAIDAYKGQIISYSKLLADFFVLQNKYVNNISQSARKRIFDHLDNMPSKTYRFEQGVCKQADMMTRCQAVASLWNQKQPKGKRKRKADAAASPSVEGGQTPKKMRAQAQ